MRRVSSNHQALVFSIQHGRGSNDVVVVVGRGVCGGGGDGVRGGGGAIVVVIIIAVARCCSYRRYGSDRQGDGRRERDRVNQAATSMAASGVV